MKALHRIVMIAAALMLGACATTVRGPAASLHGVSGQEVFAMHGVSASRRDVDVATTSSDRDPGAMARAERGIPTPQPAREPMFAPQPQPPLPAGEARGGYFPARAQR